MTRGIQSCDTSLLYDMWSPKILSKFTWQPNTQTWLGIKLSESVLVIHRTIITKLVLCLIKHYFKIIAVKILPRASYRRFTTRKRAIDPCQKYSYELDPVLMHADIFKVDGSL